MAFGHRRRPAEQVEVGAGGGAGAGHGHALRQVAGHGVAVVGQAALDPLHPVHRRALARQPGQHSRPGVDPPMLVLGPEEDEGVALHGEHRRVGAGPGVVHDPDAHATHPDGWLEDATAREHRWRLGRRSGVAAVARHAPEARDLRQVPAPSPHAEGRPPRDHRGPLLGRASAERPARHGEPQPDPGEGDGDADDRGVGPQDPDRDDQAQRHRPQLAPAPAGDEPAALERAESVPRKLSAHRRDRRRHHDRCAAEAAEADAGAQPRLAAPTPPAAAPAPPPVPPTPSAAALAPPAAAAAPPDAATAPAPTKVDPRPGSPSI